MTADPWEGAVCLGDGVTLIEIWQALHSNAAIWDRYSEDESQDRAALDASDKSLLGLLADVPTPRWEALCSAAGWTLHGAVAATWCEGATLQTLWNALEKTAGALPATASGARTARLTQPIILPETNRLSELATIAENQTQKLCFLMAAQSGPILIDLPDERLRLASPVLAVHLLKIIALHPEAYSNKEHIIRVLRAA